MYFRTEILASLLVFFAALLAVLATRGSVSGGLAGLSLSYAFETMEALAWMVLMACKLETDTVCLERIMEYWRLPQEADWQDKEEEEDGGGGGGGDGGWVDSDDRRPLVLRVEGEGDQQQDRFEVTRGEIKFENFSVR